MGAQPEGHSTEPAGTAAWAELLGNVDERDGLVGRLAKGSSGPAVVVHSAYRHLLSLLQSLAKILRVDRYWLDDQDTRNDPEYVPEAFQRLILQFLTDHRNEDFMKLEVTSQRRQVPELPRIQSLPCTTSQQRNAEMAKKRPSAETREEEQLAAKRIRLSLTASEVVAEVGHGCLPPQSQPFLMKGFKDDRDEDEGTSREAEE